MASQPSGSFFSEQSMRKATHILVAISIVALAASLIFPSLDDLSEWMTRPSDPEEIMESIVEDAILARIKVIFEGRAPDSPPDGDLATGRNGEIAGPIQGSPALQTPAGRPDQTAA